MGSAPNHKTGILYIVATPIGNLEDMTLRAIRVLGEVDLIAAEDTRHTKKLLNHFDITTSLISYYREKEHERSTELIDKLLSGESIALVSDAGTPGISDPGAVLVNKAYVEHIEVIPLAGASALSTALSVAGILTHEFMFLGFPPAKTSQRKKLLTSLVTCKTPIVFYESPHRIQSFFSDCYQILGDREVFWARELTKRYEELRKTTLAKLSLADTPIKNRGESVVIIWPGKIEKTSGQTVEELLYWYRDNSDLSLKDVSKTLANDLGLSRSQIYQQALKIWQK